MSRLGAVFNALTYGIFAKQPVAYAAPTLGGYSFGSSRPTGSLEIMGSVGTLYSVVDLLATSTARVGWHLYRTTTDRRARREDARRTVAGPRRPDGGGRRQAGAPRRLEVPGADRRVTHAVRPRAGHPHPDPRPREPVPRYLAGAVPARGPGVGEGRGPVQPRVLPKLRPHGRLAESPERARRHRAEQPRDADQRAAPRRRERAPHRDPRERHRVRRRWYVVDEGHGVREPAEPVAGSDP